MTTRNNKKKITRLAAASIIAGTVAGAAGIAAASTDLFSFSTLGSGASLRGTLSAPSGDTAAAATPTPDHKDAEGKCGEGKCG